MKGIVFTELIELVEEKWGLAMADHVLDPNGLSTGGVFTSVGTYDDSDMIVILSRLSKKTGLSLGQLQYAFGEYIFGTFLKGYGPMIERFSSTFDLVSHLDDFIHPEVRKLYPDAALPGFAVVDRNDSQMELRYSSARKMPDFAEGLMMAVAEHFDEKIKVNWEVIDETAGTFRFVIHKMS